MENRCWCCSCWSSSAGGYCLCRRPRRSCPRYLSAVNADAVIRLRRVKNPADICVVSSQFPQGESVVWRIKVYDPATGKPMDDKALDSVVVSLKDGQTFNAKYGPIRETQGQHRRTTSGLQPGQFLQIILLAAFLTRLPPRAKMAGPVALTSLTWGHPY